VNAKSLTIGGALTTLVVACILRYQNLITDDFLLLAALVLFFICVSYVVSWGATQAYKVLYHKRSTWSKENVKRKIYACAIISGMATMLVCGSFFILADLTDKEKVVVCIFWGLACTFVGFTSPFLWRWTFDKLVPRFNRYVSGKSDDENEALDRPSEAARVENE
jgi:hypothetical protein